MDAALPVLYSFRRCPYAMRARLALASSGQTVELREVVLRDKPAELIATSPKATVPVLVLPDDVVIDQSLNIMLWALKRSDPAGWMAPETESTASMMALIAQFDEGFKPHLDRYKYPGRYVDSTAESARVGGSGYLKQLEDRLQVNSHLFGARVSMADMAIAPFVRQFAQTDKAWFDAQPWPALTAWLEAFVSSALYKMVMQKYSQWVPGEPGIRFPEKQSL
ncbi:MAG TPA: glutathione S-transferase [Polaromonas sp.]|uniref:glutathione S-transferase n=1 Tax=Polaromonas sp. TaxID=1869339 RepID=UPI002D6AA6C4|nr:glutathione S-transferase [Polaromonas sp.]HYW58664.1 glutathione S-transferase [Polaromonas sp.]